MGALLASMCAACGKSAPAGPGAGAPIELSAPNDVDTFDPRFAADAYSLRASRLIHAGLVRLDPDTLEPKPYMAKSWTWIDPLTLRVELRDARFHSGAPLTPRDVAASIAAYQSPEVGSRHLRVVEAIARVDEDGPRAVVVHLARPHATLLTDLEVPILRADQATAPPDSVGALDGLGPFEVKRATRGDVLLERADDGVVPRPKHDVVIRTVHDDNARALRLLAGKSDVALNVLPLASTLEGEERASRRVAPRRAAHVHGRARRSRPARRRARAPRASPSRSIATASRRRSTKGARSPPTRSSRARTGRMRIPRPSPSTRAKRARSSARLLGDGARMHVTLLTSTDCFRVTVARALAQELADAGVDVDVTPLELGTMLARLNAGDFELAVLSFPEFTEPNVLRNLLHSSFVPPVGYNRAHIKDDALDALLDEGDRVQDPRSGSRSTPRSSSASATART